MDQLAVGGEQGDQRGQMPVITGRAAGFGDGRRHRAGRHAATPAALDRPAATGLAVTPPPRLPSTGPPPPGRLSRRPPPALDRRAGAGTSPVNSPMVIAPQQYALLRRSYRGVIRSRHVDGARGRLKVRGRRAPGAGRGARRVDLGVEVSKQDGAAVLTVTGEIDVATAPRLREHIVTLVNEGETRIVVDLQGVDFIDSTGLGALVGGLKRVRTHGGELAIVCTRPRLLKVFEITGLVRVFEIHGTVDAAVSAASG
jgi:anti-sigma B factor antagonist